MGFRFYKRIRILPGITLNLGKKGASVSLGGRGARITVGKNGIRKTVGLPGTGLFYTTTEPYNNTGSYTPTLNKPIKGISWQKALKVLSVLLFLTIVSTTISEALSIVFIIALTLFTLYIIFAVPIYHYRLHKEKKAD